jgi:hypothetical protein
VQIELTPVGIGQLPERVIVAGAGTGQDLVGHGRILARSLLFTAITAMTSGPLEIRC